MTSTYVQPEMPFSVASPNFYRAQAWMGSVIRTSEIIARSNYERLLPPPTERSSISVITSIMSLALHDFVNDRQNELRHQIEDALHEMLHSKSVIGTRANRERRLPKNEQINQARCKLRCERIRERRTRDPDRYLFALLKLLARMSKDTDNI